MREYFGDKLSFTMRRRIVFFGFGLGIGILLVCVIFNALGGSLSALKDRLCEVDAAQTRADRSVNVEAVPAGVGTMTKRVTAVGKTKASESVVIKSEIHARLKEILFTEGGMVTKDQEIILFEDADMQAELQDAQAQLALAQANFDRTSKLHEQKFGSAKEFDKDKGQLDVATARVAIAKAKLEKTIIKAPFSGHIGLINISVGAFVQSNTDLVTLVQTNPMKIDFKVAEKFVHDVGVGQSAEITIDAFKGRVFLATVEAVDSNVDSDSHSLALRATTNNDNNELMAGLFANVSLIIGERGNTIMVDEAAILREGATEFVWVVQKGKARRKLVTTGVHEKNMREVVTGISEGEIVVISGHTRLQDGVRVKVVNDKDEIERVAKEKASKAAAAEAGTQKPAKDAKADAPKADAPKVDAPKVDAPKADAPKADAPKADAPKADAPKADAPKVDAPKVDAPKVDAPKVDAPAEPTKLSAEAGQSGSTSTSSVSVRADLPAKTKETMTPVKPEPKK